MKKFVVLLVVLLFAAGSLICQEAAIEKAQQKTEEAQKKLEALQKELQKEGITEFTVDVTIDDEGDKTTITLSGKDGVEKPFVGITYSDITLAEAAEIGYNYFYGIRLTSIVSGSSAYYYRLRTDDILMAINDDKIVKQDDLGKVLSYYRVGDHVKLKLFRDGEEIEKDFVFGTRDKIIDLDGNIVSEKSETGETKVVKKKSIDYGDGTIAWMPTWYTPDVEDINKLLYGLGFEEETYSEDGIFMNGIGLKGNIGNGWFIGGQYTGFYNEKSTRHSWGHADIPNIPTIDDSTQVQRKAQYWMRYGGLSFDKRFIISKSIYSEIGCMLTWGMNELKVTQNAASDVPDFDFDGDNLSDYMDDYYNISSSIDMKNYGFLAEPRISIGWRITDWLSFKAEAAYLYSVYMSGWEAQANGYAINILNKPDTNMDGLTLSIGPWFGF